MVLLCAMVLAAGLRAQADSAQALLFSASYSLPMSASQVLERAREAWSQSFAREPGARLNPANDRPDQLEGSAHFNFRSTTLTGREETMGRVSYRVRISATNGGCEVTIGPFRHTGNRAALRGGTDLGLITAAGPPTHRPPGLSGRTTTTLLGEIRQLARQKGEGLLRNFGALLRSEP
ncbi:MAG: hypothetical protein IT228_02700 [Flavobacteriales bacterium]|nr:hypothetical protein [Flavobacteriales bacterium]MCC6576228.1 hypothetical protein [Flavobacteriales bacterium]NUQ14994.1 hypothetical protein [Flavobacteriales bacterium]